MAGNTVFRLKRSSVAGKVPNTSSLSVGELGLNLTDKILYSSDGTDVFEIGSNNTIINVTNVATIANATVNNVVVTGGFTANGSKGLAGQVLTTTGSGVYWGDGGSAGINTYLSAARIYQTFTATGGQSVFTVSGGYTVDSIDVFYNGVHLTSSEYTQDGSIITLNSAANSGALVEVSGYRTSAAGSNTDIYFNDSGALGANDLFSYDKSVARVTVGNSSVNTQITAGNIYLNGSTLVVGNTAANITINSTSIALGTIVINTSSYSGTANNTSYVGTVSAANVVSNAQLTANLANYQTSAGLSGNVATLTANNSTYLNGVAAAAYVQNTDSRTLSGNLNFTGTNTYFSTGHYANGLTLVSNSGIQFAGARNPTFSEGLVYYDSTDKSLAVYNDYNGFTLPVGQKEFVRVWNQSGATIAKGKPVYISGTHGTHYHPIVSLADASSATAYDCIGLAGHDIADLSHGYIIVRGWVGGFDTSALTAGQRVHLGYSTPGSLVTPSPQYPNYPMDVGFCLNSDAANGYIYVDLSQHTVEALRVVNNAYVGGSLTVAGDLNITGNVVTTSATTIATSENIVYLASGDTIASTTFTGSGLNDANFHGVFEGTTTTTYYVKISSTGATDTFAWSKDNFATTVATGIAITGGFQALDNGITVKFQAKTGHTLNDKWQGTAAPVNVDLGWAGNYNDGTYHHAGMFRDATDGYFKIFDSYLPELSSNVNIDTSNLSFHIANFWSNSINIGNTSVYSTINSTSYTGSANNASFLNGVSPSAYVNTSGNFTLTGVITHTSNLVSNTLIANTKIYAGTPGGFSFGSLTVLEGTADSNNYSEFNHQNVNAGNNASSDFVATADTGNDAVNFIDLGINGSGYNQAAFNIAGALDGYLYTSNSHLAIGTASVKDVILHAGGTTTTNRVLTVNTTAVTVANGQTLTTNTINSIGNINAVSFSVGAADFIANSAGVYSNSNINLTVNNLRYTFTPLAGGANVYFTLQNDDNFVFYSSNTLNQPRAVWSVFANSVTSNLNINIPVYASAGIVSRASSTTSVVSPLTWNSDNSDQIAYTALANDLTINADSGTPIDGRKMIFRFKDNGTPRTITFTTGSAKAFRAIGTTIPITTVASKTVYVGCIYHATDTRWDIVAISTEA